MPIAQRGAADRTVNDRGYQFMPTWACLKILHCSELVQYANREAVEEKCPFVQCDHEWSYLKTKGGLVTFKHNLGQTFLIL